MRQSTSRHGLLLWIGLSSLSLEPRAADAAGGGTIAGKVDVTPAKYADETVVYVKEAPGTFTPRAQAVDQKGMRFLPKVLAIAVGETVKFFNHDSVGHNVYSTDGEGFNLGTFPPNTSRDYTFKKTGAYTLLCSVHPEMLGFIYVSQNPYAAVVDKSGSYSIKDVPPGTYQVEVWNSHGKAPAQTIKVEAGKSVDANFSVKK